MISCTHTCQLSVSLFSRDLESTAEDAYDAGAHDALAVQEQAGRDDDVTAADPVQQENERNEYGNRRREQYLEDKRDQVRLEQQAALELFAVVAGGGV